MFVMQFISDTEKVLAMPSISVVICLHSIIALKNTRQINCLYGQ